MNQRDSETKPTSVPLKWLGRLPLRLRITLWVVLIFVIIQITLSFVILLYQRQAIRSSFDAVLAERSADVATDIAGHETFVDSLFLQELATRESESIYIARFSIMLFDPDSEELIAATAQPDQELIDYLTGSLGSVDTEMEFTSITTEKSGPTRVVCGRIVLGNGQEAVLVIGTSDRYSADAIKTVATVLLLIFPIGCISISVAAWLVAGLATRPIEQIQHFAERLDATTLNTDIDLEGEGVEIESLRQELQSAMKRIERTYEEQARVLANISHEVKTPISVVQTEAQVLLMKKPSVGEYRGFVKSTSEEMQRLGKMVESFLLLTRVQKGDSKVKRKVISADDLVLESYEQCQSMARQHNVVLNIVLNESEHEPSILGNADLLCTLVNNLVRNAIRFTPEKESIDLYCDVDEQTVVIGVRDRGPGIPESLLPRLFEPFTQASSERRKGRGTGLGLQIAKGIAELHGGDITVRNLEIGCTFELRIPLAN